jgi:hypothetical protein
VAKRPELANLYGDRFWDVWDEPAELVPRLTLIFQILFVTSELVVEPNQRTAEDWQDVLFFQEAPPGWGKMVVCAAKSGRSIVVATGKAFSLA